MTYRKWYWGVQNGPESLAYGKSTLPHPPPSFDVTSGPFDHVIACTTMPAPLPPTIRSKVVRLLLLHWRPDAIAEAVTVQIEEGELAGAFFLHIL